MSWVDTMLFLSCLLVVFVVGLFVALPPRLRRVLISVGGYAFLNAFMLGIVTVFNFWLVSDAPEYDWGKMNEPAVIGFLLAVVVVQLANALWIALWTRAPLADFVSIYGGVGSGILFVAVGLMAGGVNGSGSFHVALNATRVEAAVWSAFTLAASLVVAAATYLASPADAQPRSDEKKSPKRSETPSEKVQEALDWAMKVVRDKYERCGGEIEELYPPVYVEADLQAELRPNLKVSQIYRAARQLTDKIERCRVHESVRAAYREHATNGHHFSYQLIVDRMQQLLDPSSSLEQLHSRQMQLLSFIRQAAVNAGDQQPQDDTEAVDSQAIDSVVISEAEARRQIDHEVRAELARFPGEYTQEDVDKTVALKMRRWQEAQLS